MCMKNVNLNAVSCNIVIDNEYSQVSLANIGKKITIAVTEIKREIAQLSLAVFISAVQSKDPNIVASIDPDTTFAFKEKYQIRIRLTETISERFKDLETFVIDPSSSVDSSHLCKDTYNHTRLGLYHDIVLPPVSEKERFVVKLLIRRYDESREQDVDWIVQSI